MFSVVKVGVTFHCLTLMVFCCWVVDATKRLILELDVQFLEQSISDAMGIVCPQYWLQIDVEFISSTFGNVERLLPHPTCMSTIQR